MVGRKKRAMTVFLSDSRLALSFSRSLPEQVSRPVEGSGCASDRVTSLWKREIGCFLMTFAIFFLFRLCFTGKNVSLLQAPKLAWKYRQLPASSSPLSASACLSSSFLFFFFVSWLLLNTAANDLRILIALLVIDADDLSENNTFYWSAIYFEGKTAGRGNRGRRKQWANNYKK